MMFPRGAGATADRCRQQGRAHGRAIQLRANDLVYLAGGEPHALLALENSAALLTILVADVTMSLDNVLAIGALAAGNLPLLAVGLLLSIVFLLLGSALVAELMGRLPWLLDVAALVLAWTAAKMVLDDIRLGPVLEHLPWAQIVIPVAAFAIVIAADLLLRLRDSQRAGKTNAV